MVKVQMSFLSAGYLVPILKSTFILNIFCAGRFRTGTPVLAVMSARAFSIYSMLGAMKVNQILNSFSRK